MEMRPHGPEGLPQPPSAKSARTFGILGICSHLLCLLGAPFAILFGILALMRHSRAKREHAAEPETYARPRATGLVTGIVALAMLVMVLPMTGIVAAIAIPALLSSREQARSHAVEALVKQAADEVQRSALVLRGQGPGGQTDPISISIAVLAQPAFRYPAAKNPYDELDTPFRQIAVHHSPFRLGDAPEAPGEVTLEPVWEHADPSGTVRPAVVIRGGIQRRQALQVVSRTVVCD